MSAETVLKVPIQVDGLYVEAPGLNLGLPMADFSRLPYNLEGQGKTVNTKPRTPNLAERAFNPSLNGDLTFPAGLHLHWALPDALATGRQRDGDTNFPPVPNRWLVRRLDHTGKLEKAWVVESDFLHPYDPDGRPLASPPGEITAWPNNTPITFPTKRRQLSNKKAGAAFRYMGRSQLLSDWLQQKGNANEYLNQDTQSDFKLTALGYSEPAFAAYYPNCYSVFGFCDVDPNLNAGNSYEYQVIGWLNEVNLDPLQSKDFAGLNNDAARYNALQQEFRWFVTEDGRKKAFPRRIVCYASLTVTPNNVKRSPQQGAVDLAMGNTGGEALAALLADGVAKTQAQDAAKRKVLIEDQLEAMNVAPSLQGVQVDYRAHFDQLRHLRGFRGSAGGSRWEIHPKKSPSVSAAIANDEEVSQPPLPEVVAPILDALNDAQEAYDIARQEILELRYQTYCDWHKFLTAHYSNGELEPFRRQSVELAGFIQDQDLKLLNDKTDTAGKLIVTKDLVQAQGAVTASLAGAVLTPTNPDNKTLAVQVILRLKALIDAMLATQITDHFEIANRPADHFWTPREPVVLISGPIAVATSRHGQDGDLPCTVLDLPGAPGTDAFIKAVDTLKSAIPTDPCVLKQSGAPWHPIILEWGIAVRPLKTGRKDHPEINDPDIKDLLDYDSTFITQSFGLRENQPDVAPNSNLELLDRNTYEGRCVITPTAGTQLDTNLSTFLLKTTLDDCRDRTANGDAEYVNRLIKWFQTKHNIQPPKTDAEKALWLKQQKPFADPVKKDADNNPVLLPVNDVFDWYGDKPLKGANQTVKSLDETQNSQDPIYSAIRALKKLANMPVLSQALGGFNAALMTRRQVLQIPIEDPVEDEILASIHLTSDVAKAVRKHHSTAPRDFKVFSPIRSGTLTLTNLCLIDTFGQKWDAPVAGANLVTSNSLSTPEQTSIYLPPRFSTPARLNFRWLAAISGQEGIDEVEMNSAPVTPICGWLIANHFDNSLMVYDNTGLALGSINSLAEWQPAPDRTNRIAAAEIPNEHLRRLVRHLVIDVGTPSGQEKNRREFLGSFLSTIDSAMEAIEPASFAQHEALALLMGRPIAVVRARVELQLLGQPTELEKIKDPTLPGGEAMRLKKSQNWKAFVNQDWAAFAYDWGKFYGCTYDDVINRSCPFIGKPPDDYARMTHDFEKVVIPVRLGEHQLLNDGLVGFWKETNGELESLFHAPQTDKAADNLSLTLQDEPVALTMLMDPRGEIHATCGILPVYKLEIPSTYYADALKHMGVTFRVGPLVTDSEQLHAALPKGPGYAWSWITKPNGSTWDETTKITDATEQAHFFKPPKIVEGWLKLNPTDK